MMSFRDQWLTKFSIPSGAVWLMTDIARCQGRQDLFTKQSPQTLNALREMALIQSAESSNRIEGVTVDPERLRPLVLGASRPRDRSEEEVFGYRQALNLIHAEGKALLFTPALLRKLLQLIQEGAGDAGQWKKVDNEIIEARSGQPPLIRFKPVSVAHTRQAVEELCLAYQHSVEQGEHHPLLRVAAFIFDFLCIHPFRDGNGRVSRLLTLAGLYHNDFEVGRYISLERLVEESKEDYYRVLHESSLHWHTAQHDFVPWFSYFLSILRRAYREFEDRAKQAVSTRGSKTALVLGAIEGMKKEKFTLGQLEHNCPGVSKDMVRRVVRSLQSKRRLKSLGRGPGALWQKVDNKQ
jgi:Fic family protein